MQLALILLFVQHIEAFCALIRKQQRQFPNVFSDRVNVIDPYLYLLIPYNLGCFHG
ncbi:hypothetical protein ACOSQ3_009944 [Xanthoceras sorbifolium]